MCIVKMALFVTRKYSDYEVTLHTEKIPDSVEVIAKNLIGRENEKSDRTEDNLRRAVRMDYQEDEYLMLSGIQHFAFCRRQWALIHIEQQWEDNVRTVEGELMHKRAHDINLIQKSKDVLTVHALPISSKKMGVSGECDIVEFHKCEDGVKLFGHRDLYSIYPVEYKKGNPRSQMKIYFS